MKIFTRLIPALIITLALSFSLQAHTVQNKNNLEIPGELVHLNATNGGSLNTPAETEPPTYTNTDWRLIEVVWKDMSTNTALNQVQLQFSDDGKLSGSLGCNRFNSSYQVQQGKLSIGPMMTTKKTCQGEQGEVEAAMNKSLAEVNAYEISYDTLHLMVDDLPVLRFAPLSAVTLENKWNLNTLTGLRIADDIKLAEVAYLDFKKDGRVNGKTGCNQLNTSYELDRKQAEIRPVDWHADGLPSGSYGNRRCHG